MNLKKHLLNGYVNLCRILWGVDANKIVFISFHGKSYSDNPKAISEALHKLDETKKIVWLLTDYKSKKSIVPKYVRIAKTNIFSMIREIATSGTVVNNFLFDNIKKSKKQLFIQTWHGDKAFKKVVYDDPYMVDKTVVLADSVPGYCDYAIAGSEYGKKQYKSAFRYNGMILMFGTPRNDILVNPDVTLAQNIKKRLGIAQNVNLLLYAPTFRDDARKTGKITQKIDLKRILDILEKRYDKQWICLLRGHPSTVGLSNSVSDNRIKDVSKYEDMAEILLISDILITDYSSCAGDFALLKRPIFLYHEDKEEYLSKDRTFYFDIADSPYLVANDQESLEKIISSTDEAKAKENCEEILKFYGNVESGHASEMVAEIIVDWSKKVKAV